MKYLLDTHALLWIAMESENLSDKVKQVFLDNTNDFYLSAASIWEMAIKISLQKLILSEGLMKFVDKHVIGNNIQILQVNIEHIYPLENLPFHHRDPFDRMLIAQAQVESLVLLSNDPQLRLYDVRVQW